MTLKTQAKVLRVLQEQKVEPVGGTATITVDVRVIAATNKNLEDEIRKGNFREDLFFRLNVIPFHVAPLRERRDDFPAHVRDTYGINLASTYLGEPIPHPIGKGSGQLSLNVGQLETDAEAGLAFAVLKTVIAQDSAGGQVLGARAIFIGAVEEDSSGYPDCRREFYDAFNSAITLGTKPGSGISVVTPVIGMSKADIVRTGAALDAPFELSWSCYRSEDAACGRCDSCALRLKGFRDAGVPDPIPYAGV